MEHEERNKWFRNLLIFLIPIVIIYMTSLTAVMSQEGHILVLADLIPNNIMVGSILTYVMNALIDLKRKLDK